MPLVTVWPTPKGSPMASTRSPTSTLSELAKLKRRQVRARPADLQHRQIGALVLEHDVGREFALVGQRHLDLIGVLDDVEIGHDQARRVDDDAGAERALDALARLAAEIAEEVPEERIGKERRGLLLDHARGIDVDHRRRDPLDHRREGKLHRRPHWAAPGARRRAPLPPKTSVSDAKPTAIHRSIIPALCFLAPSPV